MMKHIKGWLRNRKRLAVLIIIALVVVLGGRKVLGQKSTAPQYQTAQAEKGTLIVTVTGSGQISAANSASVTTQTSGVVNKLYVENGQKVKSGDPLAQVELDMDGKQRSAQALASYLGVKNSLATAQNNYYALQSDLLTNWKTYMDTAQGSSYQNADGSPRTDQRQLSQFVVISNSWLSAEAKYKLQQDVVTQAQTSLSSAWAAYQQSSPIIYAPISGTISGLSLQIGSVLTAQTGSSGNSASQRIANIKTDALPTASVDLTQIDAPKIKQGNKVTITMDALPGKTYTGQVISLDTTGAVSSGVTTYPAVIKFDTGGDEIFPNMSVQANIITQVKNDVLLVPTSAIQTQNGQSFVRVMKNKQITQVAVETGLESSTQAEITAGLSEGDQVVTSITQPSTTNTSQTQSPFGSFGGGNAAGGAAIRRIGGN